MKRWLVTALLVALVGLGSAEPGWVLTRQGLGPVRLGMSEGELKRCLGSPLLVIPDEGLPVWRYPGFDAVVHHRPRPHRVVAVSLVGTRYATSQGLRLGCTADQVRAALGAPPINKKSVSGVKWVYGQGGQYLVFYFREGRAVQIEASEMGNL